MALPLLMSGLPGRMAMAVAEEAHKAEDIDLKPLSLSAEAGTCDVLGETEIELLGPDQRDKFLEAYQACENAIVVDYTHPSAVEGNVEFYTQHKIPFVLGTTGGDYSRVESLVVNSQTPAVVAPNMGLPIVAITAMLDWAAKEFPGVFNSYDLSVRESHQKGKADTSGTAKDLIARFQTLGANFDMDDILMCRDGETQKKDWGIPDEHLQGHAFHTYDLHSSDKSAHFSLSHNILGRSIYAKGTLDGVRFLRARLGEKVTKSYNMIDVLKNLQEK
jgi:4-hydroxy-tetrahydrodipicolinate reductase